MRKRLLAAMLAGGLSMIGFASSHAASTACAGAGTTTTPAPSGFSLTQAGDPTEGSDAVSVCNTGLYVPAPGKGSAEVYADTNGQKGYVYVDGDRDNVVDGAPDCTDGYNRADVTGGGVVFHSSGDGDYVHNRGQAMDAQGWATKTQADCS